MVRAPTTLADRVIGWYDGAARDLPWRRPGTSAWAVLVSEVMLQQTPVDRVRPVFEEWLRRWPSPAALADVPAGLAIQAWGRLGYPRRALRLHQCATVISSHHAGEVPSTVAELLALPGIGAYTARAVAAFAYGQREPVVDTNVRRLVARAYLGRPDGGTATSTWDLRTVESLLPEAPARAARASVAFMELGALICTARQPRCSECPLRPREAATAGECAWHRAGCPAATQIRRPGQRYEGTDRQARGALLALCRAAPDGVPSDVLTDAWPDRAQGARALRGLLEDGLIVAVEGARYALPGLAGLPTQRHMSE